MIKDLLDRASKAYYAGAPIMTDAVFDSLAELHSYEQLGDPQGGERRHVFKMYSLQKVHFGEAEPTIEDPVKTVKLDGAAIAITYICGALSSIVTRGNGIVGQDVTDKLSHLVPTCFVVAEDVVQINAELAAPAAIPNARNYAAGAMNLKNLEEVKSRDIHVVAYDMVCENDVNNYKTYEAKLNYLKASGFNTVDQDFDGFPTDGFVVRENDLQKFYAAGFTSKHPRAAYALKPKAQTYVTKLLDVEWNLGRTGVVAPTAILEPVKVGDAMVSRATLHNIDYIEALELEIGCQVEIIRSGEIIPRIVRKVNGKN